ncbi:sulfite dehydrogenase [Bordetella genomosp. 10]|uniref:sulfite dehydrogenase n=1 Tax=Bordetella genomosp. 10 TaxID=1416804 RepID=UPI00211B47D3|nr:sulfite dehydrogenase [Bordetella genomosp. 10]
MLSSRRQFLEKAAALGVSAAVPSAAGAQAPAAALPQPGGAPDVPLPVPPWSRTPGAPVGGQPYGKPSAFEKRVVRGVRATDKQYLSSSSRTPIAELDGIITPNGLFYERHHGGVPDIDPAQHRLLVHGLVERELLFSVEDLRRFPSVSRIHFLECSGNPGFDVHGKTAAEANGLISCAEWTGVPLRTVLEEAGLRPEARWAVAEGADAAAMTRSVPIEKCLDDALLVYSQNGERLRPEQGYPLRLLLPGFEGNMSVKWLRRLHLTAQPVYSREETAKYTDLMPDGTARQFTFHMEAKSIITAPSGGQRLSGPGFHEIRGIAWSGRGRIRRVEVSVDEGRTWRDARLQEPVLSKAVTRFNFPWRWDGAPAVIQSRAIDETGYVQPALEDLVNVRGLNSGYHNNAITPWRVAASGEVSNARL